ncbi:MAG: DUF1015 domain-containing protein [Ilumatobacteraceae bacterium]|jgi:uncharacterized protein (DUF1015 family)|nr:DUF1015 domain-containing protein [Ilumatobacteraceae bacterium]MDP5068548.1 DUF1015 domain-containing protein [Ilumatobacteraceae bacterium]
MPRFEPFAALRYSTTNSTDITALTSAPYDVFDEDQRAAYAATDSHNIVLLDYPIEADGPSRYQLSADRLTEWRKSGHIVSDVSATFSIYRMTFTDEAGTQRTTVGVIGALEVVDEGAGGVLPHERTTPKAKTDRLDLTIATHANLSPVWGLSLTAGLTAALSEAGEVVAQCTDEEGVHHVLERVSDPARIATISRLVSENPVLIADGHHRYAISRTFRDQSRTAGSPAGAELTMTYVAELVQDQLSVAAIHRLYDIDNASLISVLSSHYDTSDAGRVGPHTISEMDARGSLCLVAPNGTGTFLTPRSDTFSGVREMDSARLEHALRNTEHSVTYQHGVTEVVNKLAAGAAASAILIRPVSLAEIRRTADTGELMPPKSTFFTPKLRTGMVMRDLN